MWLQTGDEKVWLQMHQNRMAESAPKAGNTIAANVGNKAPWHAVIGKAALHVAKVWVLINGVLAFSKPQKQDQGVAPV